MSTGYHTKSYPILQTIKGGHRGASIRIYHGFFTAAKARSLYTIFETIMGGKWDADKCKWWLIHGRKTLTFGGEHTTTSFYTIFQTIMEGNGGTDKGMTWLIHGYKELVSVGIHTILSRSIQQAVKGWYWKNRQTYGLLYTIRLLWSFLCVKKKPTLTRTAV